MTPLIALLAMFATTAQAETPRPADPRIRTVPYAVDQVVRLPVAANFHTAILFGPDERVRNVAIGDSDAWEATLNEAGDALFLKPLRASGTTNMTVITDVRVYSFELSASHGGAPDAPFTVRFAYPEMSAQPAVEPGVPRLGRYTLSGARRLRPTAIVDDGVRTSIEWRPAQIIPAVFAVDELGAETLVQGQMRNGLYVIDGVHRALVFRIERHTARATRASGRAAR
ncbi:P-type conjugative transfer protein VirB9 [Brevundimonas kwangchunensis]|uniref:P-type conjugative transfer protein VirB9 n=1 Tax=Brevundimonas kwangchunensis TaxID=322163 RepID=A0ABN1GXC5_9CAUL